MDNSKDSAEAFPIGSESGLMVQAIGLCKRFQSSKATIEVLRDVDFELRTGETVAVVGASGIGKSTLLHILGTLDYPDCGVLKFNGEDIFQYDDQRLARFRNRTMGFVFQFHHLLPEFSALENTMMPAIIQGIDKSRAIQAAESILVRVGLADRLHQKVPELSGGEQQRVALARALVLKPAILLADEPTGNLDRQNSEQIHRLLLELNREMGMAIVVVTHNMELAACMSRQATIRRGRLEYISKSSC
jgi:lipoprotein-releasing system ATP-binding protein